MRRFLPFLLLILIPFAITGCPGKSDDSAPPKITAPIDNASPAAKTAAPDEMTPGGAPPLAGGGLKKGRKGSN